MVSSKAIRSKDKVRRRRPLCVQTLENRLALDASGMSPTSLFVTAAFQEVLVREVDTVALNSFSGALQSGAMSRLAFTETLTHSVEYFSSVVAVDYSQFLGRAPDGAGLAFWDNLMHAGMTDEQVEAQFIGSPEYFQHAGGTNLGWVDHMYSDLLGRQADPMGQAVWVNALNAGMPRSLAAQGFAGSAERETIIIREDYETFLGRQASSAETSGWVDRFLAGTRNEDVIAGFVASDEFFRDYESQSGLNGGLGSGSPGSVNIGTVNIGTVNININSGNINSGNVNSGNVNSGNVDSGDSDHGHPGDHGDKHHGKGDDD